MENLKEHYLNLADSYAMEALSFAKMANKHWNTPDKGDLVLKCAKLAEMNCRLAELYYSRARDFKE